MRRRVVIAGGGTGGHVFPGLAVADALRALADVEVVFVGSPRGLESRIVPAHGYTLEVLDVGPMKGGGAARAVRGGATAARATFAARRLLARVEPDVVLGVGGYAAGPVCLAAALRGIPVAVLEPNAAPGLTNRILGPFSRRAYVAWAEAEGSFRAGRTRALGVPIRAGFAAADYVCHAPPRVLVLGGSQGAQALNERVPGALAMCKMHASVLHQTGDAQRAAVEDAYRGRGVEGVRVVSFIDDVARELAAADLVVSRAGAVTVAEICAVGRPAVLIPFPFAADDHQARNARAVAVAQGAVCILQDDATAGRLAREIGGLLDDPQRRARMAAAARGLGRPAAARAVAEDLLDLGMIRPMTRRAGVNGAPGAHGDGVMNRSLFLGPEGT